MRPINRLRPWQRRLTDLAGAALLASGLVWLLLHYAIATGDLPHPGEPWAMRLHGLAAMASLFALGLLSAAHIPHGWQLTQGRRAPLRRGLGLALCVLAGLLVASGYALYYLVPEALRPALGLLHSGAGALMAVALAGHRRARVRRGS